jgi:hypothetical protein
MKIMNGFVLLALGCLLVACGVDSSCDIKSGCTVEAKNENKELTYQLVENGCDTGKVKYNDDGDYCAALKSDSRNNYCARSMRRQAFESRKCPGTFFN